MSAEMPGRTPNNTPVENSEANNGAGAANAGAENEVHIQLNAANNPEDNQGAWHPPNNIGMQVPHVRPLHPGPRPLPRPIYRLNRDMPDYLRRNLQYPRVPGNYNGWNECMPFDDNNDHFCVTRLVHGPHAYCPIHDDHAMPLLLPGPHEHPPIELNQFADNAIFVPDIDTLHAYQRPHESDRMHAFLHQRYGLITGTIIVPLDHVGQNFIPGHAFAPNQVYNELGYANYFLPRPPYDQPAPEDYYDEDEYQGRASTENDSDDPPSNLEDTENEDQGQASTENDSDYPPSDLEDTENEDSSDTVHNARDILSEPVVEEDDDENHLVGPNDKAADKSLTNQALEGQRAAHGESSYNNQEIQGNRAANDEPPKKIKVFEVNRAGNDQPPAAARHVFQPNDMYNFSSCCRPAAHQNRGNRLTPMANNRRSDCNNRAVKRALSIEDMEEDDLGPAILFQSARFPDRNAERNTQSVTFSGQPGNGSTSSCPNNDAAPASNNEQNDEDELADEVVTGIMDSDDEEGQEAIAALLADGRVDDSEEEDAPILPDLIREMNGDHKFMMLSDDDESTKGDLVESERDSEIDESDN